MRLSWWWWLCESKNKYDDDDYVDNEFGLILNEDGDYIL